MTGKETYFTRNLANNIKLIKQALHDTPELKVRTLEIGKDGTYDAALLYLNGLVDSDVIRNGILGPLLKMQDFDEKTGMKRLANRHIRSESVNEESLVSMAVEGIVRGKTIILVEGFNSGILVESSQWEKRQIEQSTRQVNMQGPLIAFSEQLRGNLNLLHNLIQSPNLLVEKRQIGIESKKEVAIIYLADRVDQKSLTETLERIDSLHVDYVLESRIIDRVLEGEQRTIFPLVFTTELPDATASALYEGRIAILVNGTPTATIVPCLFVQFFQQPSDYYIKQGNSMRFLSFICFLLTTLLPGSYLALANFHENWVPKPFHKTFFVETETLFPVWFEVFLMIFLLQIISFGSFKIQKDSIILLSLIATVTIGSTAVDAKVVHEFTLIVVGVAFLANTLLTVGTLSFTLYYIRYAFLLIGSLFGFTGIIVSFILMIIHLSYLRSVGVPYLAPFIPFNKKEFKDVFYRGNLKKLINSPHKYPHDDKE